VAEKFPELVKQIQQAGHEIGSHGQQHRQLFKATRDEFFQEMSRCKKTLEDLTGQQVLGFRAPAFSLLPQTSWALEVLAELGFHYDSSIYPMSNTRYGWPGFNPEIHRLELESGRTIIEVPMSKISVGFKELGVGGGYLVFFPYGYTRMAVKRIQKKRPAIIYMHPYEIDTLFSEPHAQLLRKCDIKTRLRCIIRKEKGKSTSQKIKRLVQEFNFAPLCDVIKSSLETTKETDIEC
jgi:polysaccharide deacetylase family protein (PEP-CTERM system associated)